MKIAFLLASIFALFSGPSSQELLPEHAGWKVIGNFALGGVYPTTKFDEGVKRSDIQNRKFWGSWNGDDRSTGELISPGFRAPWILEMLVCGYPAKGKNGIFLEREDTHARMPIRVPTLFEPRERWQDFYWVLPSGWRGRNVHLIALDDETGPGGWLGVSTPRAISWIELSKRQLPLASIILLYPLALCLFLLPGLAVAMALAARRQICPVYTLMISIVVSGIFGYAAFWAYFAGKPLGKSFSFMSIAASGCTMATILKKSARLRSTCKHIAVPFLYVLPVGIFYLCMLLLFGSPPSAGARLANVRFFEDLRPGDNRIPLFFAEKLYNGEPVRPFCCGDWLSSDRPPLQAGIVLFQRPLMVFGEPGLRYQALGTALQCLWLCGVWSLLERLRTPDHRVRQVLGFLVFSGFLFEQSVYVWPKLLAATFILFCLTILFDIVESDRPTTWFQAALAAASFSLAVMAHPGSVFSLPAFLLILIPKRRLLPVRQCVLGGIVIGLFMAPWAAYQKFYDPPGNRLVKMHLAGVYDIDSRSTWQALRDSYTKWQLNRYIRFKLANLSTLIGPKPVETFGLTSFQHGLRLDPSTAEKSRFIQEQYVWNAIGVLNGGWVAALLLLLRKRNVRAIRYAGFLVIASALNLVVWSLMLFGPGQTFTTDSSYADIFLLSIGLCGFLLVLPSFVPVILFALQIFNCFVVWIFSPPVNLGAQPNTGTVPIVQLPLLIIGVSCAIGFTWHFAKSYFQETRDDTTDSNWPRTPVELDEHTRELS